MKKLAKTKSKLSENIQNRWSPRAFNPNKNIEDEKILALCEAAQWAPSSAGDEPWRFIVFNKHKDKEQWQKAFILLDEYNQIWVKNAPVLIVCCADKYWRKDRNKYNRWSNHDAGAASENLHLEAVNQGLITHPMGGFNIEKFKNEFRIPDDIEVLSMIAIGYQGDISILDEFNQKRENADRRRRKLSELFFDSEWGKSLFTE